ncbi:hypothetical protein F5887DRAFT_946645 [Amanita rubescens]|nr:hypothetical protein F5887DRAFT_946645 [Amanita rubescens]
MASGVTASNECLDVFKDLKLGKRHKYIIFNLNNTFTEIVVEKSSSSTDYDEFMSDLPEDQCRWAVYDLEFEKEGAGKRNKLVFVSWSPDVAKIKQKMLFASSRDALRKALVGIPVEVQASDPSEISYETGTYSDVAAIRVI